MDDTTKSSAWDSIYANADKIGYGIGTIITSAKGGAPMLYGSGGIPAAPAATGSSSNTLFIIGGVIVLALVIYFLMKGKK